MSKVKKVLEIIEELKACSRSLEEAALDLEEMFNESVPEKKEDSDIKKKISLEELRGLMAQKSRDGFTKEMKAVITQRGYSRLTEVPENQYQEMFEQVKGVGANE